MRREDKPWTPQDSPTLRKWKESTPPGNRPAPAPDVATENDAPDQVPASHWTGDVLETLRYPEWFIFQTQAASAIQFLEDRLGRKLNEEERTSVYNTLKQHVTTDAVTQAMRGSSEWDPADSQSGFAFASGALESVQPLWGDLDSETILWHSGEFALLFGDDGSYKTTLAHNLIMGLVGIPGFEECLGLTVESLPAGAKVLYLALDRHKQSQRSLWRFLEPLSTEDRQRFDDNVEVWAKPVPVDGVEDPDGFVNWIHEYASETGSNFRVVIIDNISDAFGDLSDTTRAEAAGRACNRLANTGIDLLALHHPRKTTGIGKKPTEAKSLDDIYGGRMFRAKSGAALSLFVKEDQSTVSVRQLKGPFNAKYHRLIVWNNETGRPGQDIDPGQYQVGSYHSLEALKEATVREVADHVYDGADVNQVEAIRQQLKRSDWADPVIGDNGKVEAYRFVGEDG